MLELQGTLLLNNIPWSLNATLWIHAMLRAGLGPLSLTHTF